MMMLSKGFRATVTDLTDEEDVKAALNLCFMKHFAFVSSEKEKHVLKVDSRIEKQQQEEEAMVSVAQGLKRKAAVHIKEERVAMNIAQQSLFYGNYTPPSLPPVPSLQQFIRICSKPFEKQLTSSDVRDDQSRLAMSKEYVKNHLMPLLNENEDLSEGIKVTTYDLAGAQYPMMFKTWVSKIHVLTGGWKAFRNDHGLVEKQDFVIVWMFRNIATGNLCFAIGLRRFPEGIETIKRRRVRQN